ncbi:MAG: signal recognition particle-docking protein FtsY [Thermoguttaceae bacterium]
MFSGIFTKIKQGLAKTARILNTDIRDIFKTQGRLVDAEFLKEMFETFVKTDMGVVTSKEITDEISAQHLNRVVHLEDVLRTTRDKLKELMRQGVEPIRMASSPPTVVMVCGVNGCGKTTTIAKLTQLFSREKKKVVLGAADTFRAAAVEQLTVWAERLGAEIVTGAAGSDPASVAHKAVSRAREIGADVCIVDTAGRLQTQRHLMQELGKIGRVIGKQVEGGPHEVLLVIDATTGQNGLSQAKHFSDAAKCSGIVLTKLDGTAKGGIVVAIRKHLDIPVRYIGVGETADDLVPFDADAFVDGMFADE